MKRSNRNSLKLPLLRNRPGLLFNKSWYASQSGSGNHRPTQAHYLASGWRLLMSPHPLFSTAYYLESRPDVAASQMEPLTHFVKFGWRENANPHPLLSTEYYVAQKPDLQGLDPLTHYVKIGWKQGLQISPHFDGAWYLSENPDVAMAGIEPLTHFIRWGQQEGRAPKPAESGASHSLIGGSTEVQETTEMRQSTEQSHRMLLDVGSWFKSPEPKIKPENLVQTISAWDAVLSRNVGVFRSFREQGPFSALTDGAAPDEGLLLKAKLSSIGADASLPESWVARAASEMSAASYVERFASLGVTPDAVFAIPTPTGAPILDNYNAARVDATKRFQANPEAASTGFDGPTISVLLPVYRTPLVYLERAIVSILGQTYANWELVIVDDCSDKEAVAGLLRYYEALDRRIKCISLSSNLGIAAATNIALDASSGEYVALFDHDDMLTCDALQCIAAEINANTELDLLYSDECKIDQNNIAVDIFTKPDWSPYLLLNCMYTGHLSAYRRSFIQRVGIFDSAFDFSQDYDLALRAAEHNPKVKHIERVLYGWRMIEGSAAMGGKPTARNSNIAALQAAMDRRGYGGTAVALPMANRAKRSFSEAKDLVSIVVPSDNVAQIQETISSILKRTTYGNFEIVVVTNSDVVGRLERFAKPGKVRLLKYDLPYNFSAKCNVGAQGAHGKYVVFFNDDVRIISPDWIECILEYLTLPDIGIVGPKLLYEDGRIQHAGMLTGVRRLVGTAFHTFPSKTPAHFNFAQSVREVSVICGACLAMPLEVFNEVDGFDAENAGIAHSDVDLCFRVREIGYKCIYTPHAQLTHIGHLSIGKTKKKKAFKKDKADIFLMKRWGQYCARDPFFPPAMRDILYIDSQERFEYYPSPPKPDCHASDVLIFSHDLSASGAPKVVLDMASVLIATGCFVVVISPEDGPMRHRLTELGAHVVIDPLALSQNSNVTDLGKNFDIIIANTAVCWPVVSQFAKFAPVYWYFHETELVDQLALSQPKFREALSKATGIWSGSDTSRGYIRKYSSENVTIVPYGVEAPRLLTSSVKGDRIVVSVLATIEPRKGQDLAIQGYLKLPSDVRQQCKLQVAGRVNAIGFHEALLEFVRGSDDIEIEDALDFDTYLSRLRDSDIIVCASRDDTLPLVSLNALAEGKILICSRETGTSGFIEDGVSGFVLKSNDPDTICDVITHIVRNYESLSDVRSQAALVYERNFTAERFAIRLLAALGISNPAKHVDPVVHSQDANRSPVQ